MYCLGQSFCLQTFKCATSPCLPIAIYPLYSVHTSSHTPSQLADERTQSSFHASPPPPPPGVTCFHPQLKTLPPSHCHPANSEITGLHLSQMNKEQKPLLFTYVQNIFTDVGRLVGDVASHVLCLTLPCSCAPGPGQRAGPRAHIVHRLPSHAGV